MGNRLNTLFNWNPSSRPNQSRSRPNQSRSRLNQIRSRPNQNRRVTPVRASRSTNPQSRLPAHRQSSNGPNSHVNRSFSQYQMPPVQHLNMEALILHNQERMRLARTLAIIYHLPQSSWKPHSSTKEKVTETEECCICMEEYVEGDRIRFLPCMHYYHRKCIDEWLVRSFTCPTCSQSVEVALSGAQFS